MENLSEKVIRYRARHNMSQGEFAAKCGVTRMTVRNIEDGKHKATAVTVAKIKMALEEDAE